VGHKNDRAASRHGGWAGSVLKTTRGVRADGVNFRVFIWFEKVANSEIFVAK
jgi:hypothetical protein